MNIFEIEKLNCCYEDKRRKRFVNVLEMEDISIKQGEITVILGPSGSGKSTFMEAISLMSDTIDKNNSINVIFKSNAQKRDFNLATIDKSIQFLQDLRFRNFCFIFQDTNIMGNFNPVENVALPKMVDEERNGIALELAEEVLRHRLNLMINLTNQAIEYSGGQKQRFAFARAFLAKGDVLFGDEPTGNLDKYNSEKLFNVISQHVKTSVDRSKDHYNKIGAIIVTHSIDLALEFADKIIVIVKPERVNINADVEPVKGYSNPFLVYVNEGKGAWRDNTEETSDTGAVINDESGFLPPIDDDGSTRFTYKSYPGDKKLIKDTFKKEIIFFLNNSYTVAQKVLIHVARELNKQLRVEKLQNGNHENVGIGLFNKFQKIKDDIIGYIEKESVKRIKIDNFEKEFLSEIRELYTDDPDILGLLPEHLN